MKRKGFTLVELLIVVAILGALAAVMTVSTGSSISKARATTIAHNLRICTTGAQLYYLESGDSEDLSTITTKQVLDATVPNFSEFSTGNIKYTSSDQGHDKWKVTVELSGTDKTEIMTALSQVKGFSNLTSTNTKVNYILFTGVATGE